MEKKYSEVGVQINLYCKNGIDSVGMTEQEKSNGSSICENNKNLLWKKC